MEINLLRTFLAIARAESISLAADELHITQPTLSRQLAALETELGFRLFRRGKRKMSLTAEGARFRQRAREILELIEKTRQEFTQDKDSVSGDIHIGSGETWAFGLVAKIMREIRQDYPSVRFHVYSGDGDEVGERLNSGLLDFGLFIEPSSVSAYDSVRLPIGDTWGVLTQKDGRLGGKKGVKPEDLWDEPLIISKQSMMERHIARWMRRDFSELNIAATYNLLCNASVMVREGVGHALGLDRLIHVENDDEICFRPCLPALSVAVYFAWKKRQAFSKASALFLKRIKGIIQ